MRPRITEIGENAVAHVLGHEAAGFGDDVGTQSVIAGDSLPQFFWIEPSRQGSRAYKVDEHYSEVTSLGGGDAVDACRRGRHGLGECRPTLQGGNRIKQLAAMANRRHADRDKIVGRQAWQHRSINIVIAERLFIPLQS